MVKFSGNGVSGGIAVGKLFLFRKEKREAENRRAKDAGREEERFEAARAEASRQLGELRKKAFRDAGEEGAGIFEAHQMILEDEEFLGFIHAEIAERQASAEYAVAQAGDKFAGMLAAIGDERLRERAADVRDVAERLAAILSGGGDAEELLREPMILAAEELTPSETARFPKEKLLAVVTRRGSEHSHAAILARTMGVPAVVCPALPLSPEANGKEAAVDGDAGEVYLEPDEGAKEALGKKRAERLEEERRLRLLREEADVTLDGRRVRLYANIGRPSDVDVALRSGAGGIGLFRSEFLYLERSDFPTEEEQFRAYREVLERMGGKKVIVRTMDIGADKTAGYFGLDKEENPAMGCRAIRICLSRPELFKTQMRALYRASCYGNLAVMFPMVASAWEVKKLKELAAEARGELAAASVPFREAELGVMVETPAAALISDELAEEVDFFSVGTNDLTQYALAADRQNAKLEAFYQPRHTAVLRLIGMTVKNAHAAGIWVGICGELAADVSMTETFLRMGVDELSVSPSMILRVRKAIREADCGAQRPAPCREDGMIRKGGRKR